MASERHFDSGGSRNLEGEHTPGGKRLTSSDATTYKIWITADWYVEVDSNGFVKVCYEGTLGCILQLRSGDPVVQTRLALKLPRLVTDTIRENAYVCEIMQDECSAVLKARGFGPAPFLLGTQVAIDQPLMGLRSTSGSRHREAVAQDGHLLMFCFQKDQRPRVCAVRYDSNSLSAFPGGARSELERIITKDRWDALTQHGCQSQADGNPSFRVPVFCAVEESEYLHSQVGALPATMDLERTTYIWYAGLPSILFDWADGTLQQAISTNELLDWETVDHFRLFTRVLRGLETLHSKGMLHGDIRPANVMGIGGIDRPDCFLLGDYGSFSIGKARVGESETTGHTLVGAGVGNQRVSPFYAPERKTAIQRESVDTAIVLHAPKESTADEDTYLVYLCWSEPLFGPGRNHVVTDEIQKRILDFFNTHRHLQRRPPPESLQEGDRLRIRDYVFEVVDCWHDGNDILYQCRTRFAHVLHNRIAVYDQENVGPDGRRRSGIQDREVISIPEFAEYRQWSAATDMYGVGALSLYTLFSCGARKHSGSEQGERTNGGSQDRGEIERTIEERFSEMLDVLESRPYFQSFWEDLEEFRRELESKIEENDQRSDDASELSARDLAAHLVQRRKETSQTLRDFAVEAVNNIVQSAPHVGIILEQVNRNMAHFLLFMHFSLCCLHRETHMKTAFQSVQGMKPFCRSRLESTVAGAAQKARERLEQLQRHLDREMLRSFTYKGGEIAEFDPRSDFNIRLDYKELKESYENARRKVQMLRSKSQSIAEDGLGLFLSSDTRQKIADLMHDIAETGFVEQVVL